MSDTFRAFLLSDAGTPRGRVVSWSVDDLDPGDVTVRVDCSDVNYKDALAATGKGRILRRPSCIGGIDFAGTVSASKDARFRVGDAVLATGFELGVSHHGGYAEYARVPGDWLVPLPATMSPHDAMAMGTAGFTAALAILRMEQNGLTPDAGPVVVSGATGGVGSIAVAALTQLGYRVTALTGKAGQEDYLRGIGASEVLERSTLDFTKLKPLGPSTWGGAIDNLGGDVLAWMVSTSKINGVVASIGLAMDSALHTTVMPFILRGVSLLGINSSDSPSPALRTEAWRRLSTDVPKDLIARMTRTIAFDELPQVFDDFVNGRIIGRVVVRL